MLLGDIVVNSRLFSVKIWKNVQKNSNNRKWKNKKWMYLCIGFKNKQ